jgi:hypothetical protein
VVVVTKEPGSETYEARVIGAFGDVGGVADRIDVHDLESRLAAAAWLEHQCGVPGQEVLDALADARVRVIVRSELDMRGVAL